MHFVVLSSSRGTTFQAVLDRIGDGSLTAKCLGLVTDRDDRGAGAKARGAGLPVIVVPRSKDESRDDYDTHIDRAIRSLLPEPSDTHALIAALGWMYILGGPFVARWKNRIINVHPSLLPKLPGVHAIEDALDMHAEETGMTIHLIDEGIDTGPILLQKKCPISPDDTAESLKERIQSLEKEWYPKVLQMIESENMILP